MRRRRGGQTLRRAGLRKPRQSGHPRAHPAAALLLPPGGGAWATRWRPAATRAAESAPSTKSCASPGATSLHIPSGGRAHHGRGAPQRLSRSDDMKALLLSQLRRHRVFRLAASAGRPHRAAGDGGGRRTRRSPAALRSPQAAGRTRASTLWGRSSKGSSPIRIPPEKLQGMPSHVQLPPDVKVIRSCTAPESFRRHARRPSARRTATTPIMQRANFRSISRYAARLKRRARHSQDALEAAQLLGRRARLCRLPRGGLHVQDERTDALLLSTIEEKPLSRRGTLYSVRVTGNGFLYNMVRILAGELFAVGCGKPEGITRAFRNGGAKRALGDDAPAQGLVLESADYGIAELLP